MPTPQTGPLCALSPTHMCQDMAKGVPFSTDRGVIYLTSTYPDHPLILRMNTAVTQKTLTLLNELIDEYLCIPSGGPDGAPGYPMGGLEPVFLHAISENRPSIVALLMSRGVHLCDKNLYNACAWDTSPEIFQVFLDYGWDINKPMNWARAPPLSLVLDKHELVVWFLDHGADPNAECKIGVSPFMEATSKASLEIVQLLHRHGARPGITATCAAQSSVPGRFEVLKYLLDIGTPIDAIDFEHNAIGQASIIQLGPAINHAVCNKETNTKEKEKMIELLLARGARTDIPDYFFKRTAVDLAMEYGTSKTIEMMRKYTVRRSKI